MPFGPKKKVHPFMATKPKQRSAKISIATYAGDSLSKTLRKAKIGKVAVQPNSNQEEKIVAPSEELKEFVCTPCSKTFTSLTKLQVHEAYSKLHAMHMLEINDSGGLTSNTLQIPPDSNLLKKGQELCMDKRRTMKVVMKKSKFLWRIRGEATIVLGKNEMGQCCLSIQDQHIIDEKVVSDVLIFMAKDAMIKSFQESVPTKFIGPQHKQPSEETLHNFIFSKVEVGMGETETLQLILPGVKLWKMAQDLNSQEFCHVFPYLNKVSQPRLPKLNPVQSFYQVQSSFNEESTKLKSAIQTATSINSTAQNVVENLIKDPDSMAQLFQHGELIFSKKDKPARPSLRVVFGLPHSFRKGKAKLT